MDSIRGEFLLQGAKDEFKYHMAKWETVSRPQRPRRFRDHDISHDNSTHHRVFRSSFLLIQFIWKFLLFQKKNNVISQIEQNYSMKIPAFQNRFRLPCHRELSLCV
jgi:hypothetical protein